MCNIVHIKTLGVIFFISSQKSESRENDLSAHMFVRGNPRLRGDDKLRLTD